MTTCGSCGTRYGAAPEVLCNRAGYPIRILRPDYTCPKCGSSETVTITLPAPDPPPKARRYRARWPCSKRGYDRDTVVRQINASPRELREYVKDLETRADPAGDLWRIAALEERCEILERELRKYVSEKLPGECQATMRAAGAPV